MFFFQYFLSPYFYGSFWVSSSPHLRYITPLGRHRRPPSMCRMRSWSNACEVTWMVIPPKIIIFSRSLPPNFRKKTWKHGIFRYIFFWFLCTVFFYIFFLDVRMTWNLHWHLETSWDGGSFFSVFWKDLEIFNPSCFFCHVIFVFQSRLLSSSRWSSWKTKLQSSQNWCRLFGAQ